MQEASQEGAEEGAPASPRCTLLGETFGIFVQIGLGIAAITTLIYKRATERPRRPVRCTKKPHPRALPIGVLQHLVNMAFGVLFARSGTASECSWYLLNFTVSVACGVVILWGVMKVYTYAVERYHITLLRSGEYGSPPNWKPWIAQMLIWGFLASSEKILTAVVIIVPLHSSLDKFAAWIEAPLQKHPSLELVLVMVLAPVILNTFFFWVIDSIIMRKRHGDGRHSEGGDEDDRPSDDEQPLLQEEGGCHPPFTPTHTSPGFQPAALPPSTIASRCRVGASTSTNEVEL